MGCVCQSSFAGTANFCNRTIAKNYYCCSFFCTLHLSFSKDPFLTRFLIQRCSKFIFRAEHKPSIPPPFWIGGSASLPPPYLTPPGYIVHLDLEPGFRQIQKQNKKTTCGQAVFKGCHVSIGITL